MTDPIKSKYDIHPYDPSTKGNGKPQDVGNTDSPELKVAWNKRPSFNTDPKDISEGASGNPGDQTTRLDVDRVKIDLATTSAQVENMLTTARSLVQSYEELKHKVLGGKDTVFGQQAMTTSFQTNSNTTYLAPGTVQAVPGEDDPEPINWQEPAKKFAASMNPVQEKALQSIGSTLELLGEYIALVNHSGQVYAHTDKQSNFPPPPPNGVHG